MKLAVWTYEGPPHVGAMRVATAMRDLHFVLHAPQGDTYADLLFTMIERRDRRPPVTYTTFKARDLGADTAAGFQRAIAGAYDRHRPAAMLVGASCTAELIQDDPDGLSAALGLPVPVIPLELSAYQRRESWGAAETFYRIVRALASGATPTRGGGVRCNLLGATALGFRHRDDLTEVRRLIEGLGIGVEVVAPYDAGVADIARLPRADFNVVLYPEIAETAARWLERQHGQPYTRTVPIGVGATRDFIDEVTGLARAADPDFQPAADAASLLSRARLPWYSASVDSNYLTGKRVFIFGDATHALAAVRVAREEFAFEVVGLGTYAREFARPVREAASRLGLQALITDDYLEVEEAIAECHPELILGTQMERHIAKRLGLPCAVISAPVHVQDFPARYSPQMGPEGANVLFDTWVHPLTMGLEEHLLTMFREDFEFNDGAGPSHLGGAHRGVADPRAAPAGEPAGSVEPAGEPAEPFEPAAASTESVEAAVALAVWSPDAERELRKIPFFVRGKARRNTERFARERGLREIALETLYDAKAHFAR